MQSTNKSISQQIYTKIQMYSIKYYLRYIKSKVYGKQYMINSLFKKLLKNFYKFKETYYINEKDSYKLFKF